MRPRAWRRGHQASSRRRAGNQRRPPCLGDPTDASVAGSSRSHSTPSWRGLDLHVDAGRYRSHRDSSQEGAVGEPPRRVRPPVTTNDWRVLRRISVSEQTRLRAGLLGHAFRTSYIHIHCRDSLSVSLKKRIRKGGKRVGSAFSSIPTFGPVLGVHERGRLEQWG